jgi:hypothetical protein
VKKWLVDHQTLIILYNISAFYKIPHLTFVPTIIDMCSKFISMIFSLLMQSMFWISASAIPCPGTINIAKMTNNVPIINGGTVNNNGVSLNTWTRVHFGIQGGCHKYGKTHAEDLLTFKLLNSKLKYTIDLSGVRVYSTSSSSRYICFVFYDTDTKSCYCYYYYFV